MNLEEIKEAVSNGEKVCWKQSNYVVEKTLSKSYDPLSKEHIIVDDYDIVCRDNGHRIGLTWTDETTMNGKEEDFYIFEECEDAV